MPPKSVRLWPDSATILERSRGVFFAQWGELLRLRRAVLKTSDLDDIHELRVASRRFRAALELFAPLVKSAPTTELKKAVRESTRSLGVLRNIDEALLFFKFKNRTDVPVDSALCAALSDLRPREFKHIKKSLTDFDHCKLDRMVREMIAELNIDCITSRNRISLLAYFSDASIRKYLPIHQLLAVSTKPENSELRHALRIAIKKWRYFFEIVAVVLERDYTQFLGVLREYQSLLGRMNDVAEFRLLLSKFRLPPDERENVEKTLLAEDALVLEEFTELVVQKPLVYTFLI